MAVVMGGLHPDMAMCIPFVEGAGFYDQENFVYVETTYFDIVEDRAKWSMITRSKDLDHNDTAKDVIQENRLQDEVHGDLISSYIVHGCASSKGPC